MIYTREELYYQEYTFNFISGDNILGVKFKMFKNYIIHPNKFLKISTTTNMKHMWPRNCTLCKAWKRDILSKLIRRSLIFPLQYLFYELVSKQTKK